MLHPDILLDTIYIYKEDCLSLSFCLDAFSQFSRYRAETSQIGRGLPGQGRRGLKILGVHRGGGGWRWAYI